MHIPLWHFKKKVTYSDGYIGTFHKYCLISYLGIEFNYKNDDIVLLWPWKRKDGKKWLSFGCWGTFNSLVELDTFWREWYIMKAANQITEGDYERLTTT